MAGSTVAPCRAPLSWHKASQRASKHMFAPNNAFSGANVARYVDFAMNRVRMFQHFGVTPYFVFDGDFLPSKAGTESSRGQRRAASRKVGLELLKAGKRNQAHMELQKSIDVTPEMARHLIEELKKANIPYVVAPYEADAQLVYLERQGLVNGIVSEDSDLLVFGAKRLLTKMDQYGNCVEINRKDFCAVREISLTGWTDAEFRHMAILSGCDYHEGPSGMGLKTAYRMLRKYKTPERLIRMLQFDGKIKVPENYLAEFKQAELTFLYQRVFCPIRKEIVLLTDPDPSVDVEKMPFIGALIEPELARSIAVGDVNPITKEGIVVPPSPSKRRISQVCAATPAPVAKKPLGIPITEYFKNHRIPLGEMDPNCFAPQPSTANAETQEETRPVVFPLPRPYVEEPASRPYTSRSSRRKTASFAELTGLGEDESLLKNRRHTAGPIIQVYQDTASSTRASKKVRLCDDLPVAADAKSTPEHSRFFSTSKPKRSAKKPADQFLMSDDSIDEVFRSMPDFDCLPPMKPAKTLAAGILDSPSSMDHKRPGFENSARGSKDIPVAEDNVEVPASSPLTAAPVRSVGKKVNAGAVSPFRSRLEKFGYKTAGRGTRMVHGLPTPSSSTEKPSSPVATPKSTRNTPRLTPLQRIGAQALGRERRSPSSSSRWSTTGTKSQQVDSQTVNAALVPLPNVDLQEVEALNLLVGSEDQIVPDSDGENDADSIGVEVDAEGSERKPATFSSRLNLSQFLYG